MPAPPLRKWGVPSRYSRVHRGGSRCLQAWYSKPDPRWLRRRAAAMDDATFSDALWFWHEVGSLLHYRDVPRLAGEVFVDTNWILGLINGLVEQAQLLEGPGLEEAHLLRVGPGLGRGLARPSEA